MSKRLILADNDHHQLAESWKKQISSSSSEVVVIVTDTQITESALQDVTLVIVARQQVPENLRAWEGSVLVLNPNALFQLGMCHGDAKVDYGSMAATESSLMDDRAGRFGQGISKQFKLSPNGHKAGWAIPEATATPIIRIPTEMSESRCAAFIYEPGEPMPGMHAAGRRAAFLSHQVPATDLSSESTQVLNRLLIWLKEKSFTNSNQTTWFNTTTPTRTLSQFEYRDWVQEQIASKMLKQVMFWVSGGLIALFALAFTWIETNFKKGLREEFKEEIKEEAEDAAALAIAKNRDLTDSISDSLTNEALFPLQDKNVTLDQYLIGNESLLIEPISNKLKSDPELLSSIVNEGLEQSINKVLKDSSEELEIIISQNLSQKAQALIGKKSIAPSQARNAIALLLFFEKDEQKIKGYLLDKAKRLCDSEAGGNQHLLPVFDSLINARISFFKTEDSTQDLDAEEFGKHILQKYREILLENDKDKLDIIEEEEINRSTKKYLYSLNNGSKIIDDYIQQASDTPFPEDPLYTLLIESLSERIKRSHDSKSLDLITQQLDSPSNAMALPIQHLSTIGLAQFSKIDSTSRKSTFEVLFEIEANRQKDENQKDPTIEALAERIIQELSERNFDQLDALANRMPEEFKSLKDFLSFIAENRRQYSETDLSELRENLIEYFQSEVDESINISTVLNITPKQEVSVELLKLLADLIGSKTDESEILLDVFSKHTEIEKVDLLFLIFENLLERDSHTEASKVNFASKLYPALSQATLSDQTTLTIADPILAKTIAVLSEKEATKFIEGFDAKYPRNQSALFSNQNYAKLTFKQAWEKLSSKAKAKRINQVISLENQTARNEQLLLITRSTQFDSSIRSLHKDKFKLPEDRSLTQVEEIVFELTRNLPKLTSEESDLIESYEAALNLLISESTETEIYLSMLAQAGILDSTISNQGLKEQLSQLFPWNRSEENDQHSIDLPIKNENVQTKDFSLAAGNYHILKLRANTRYTLINTSDTPLFTYKIGTSESQNRRRIDFSTIEKQQHFDSSHSYQEFVIHHNSQGNKVDYQLSAIAQIYGRSQGNAVSLDPMSDSLIINNLKFTNEQPINWFKISRLQETSVYKLTIDSSELDTLLTIIDQNGREIREIDDEEIGKESVEILIPAGQTYYVKASPYHEGRRGSYDFSITKKDPPEMISLANDQYEKSDIELTKENSSLHLVLPTNDRPRTYAIGSRASSDESIQTEIDIVISVFDTNGKLLIENDGSVKEDFSSYLEIEVPANENYHVELSFYDEDSEGGRCALAVEPLKEQIPDNDVLTTALFKESVYTEENQSFSDLEEAHWTKIPASSESTNYTIGTLSEEVDTILEVFDAEGYLIAKNDDGGGEAFQSYLELALPDGGDYYIKVSLYPGALHSIDNNYTLELSIQQPN